ncbi:MAG TPA: N-acetylmuramoyl-L-alanine amidase [Rhodanobacteraceae bacterium]|nr:N-acetylmuramoyl-L-alanine amidase [Rhodanobacteraceae bacterium]
MELPIAIRDQPLPYVERLERRPLQAIDLVVIHCTELPDLATARAYGERRVHPSGTGNSGHYYVDRDGTVLRYVPDDRVAHHVRDCNEHSIGIELVNTGRWPDWFDSRRQVMTEPYPEAQIEALLALVAHLRTMLPNLCSIAGHEELDAAMVAASDDATRQVRRKLDPGPMFPWARVLTACGLHRLTGSPRSL